jgi:hypothetical protein
MIGREVGELEEWKNGWLEGLFYFGRFSPQLE